jgi:hypothetical protein
MKNLLAITVILVSSLAVGQKTPVKRDYTAIFLDNIARVEDGEDFANAFALEPACSGLSLTLWTSIPTWDAWNSDAWAMMYGKSEDGVGGTLIQDNTPQGGFDPKQVRHFSIAAHTDHEAARRVCFIVKGKGGKIR